MGNILVTLAKAALAAMFLCLALRTAGVVQAIYCCCAVLWTVMASWEKE